MKTTHFFLLIIFTVFTQYCSSPDYIADAEKAMQNANYGEAIKLWEKARQQENYDKSYDQKIALTYMLRGQELYNRTKNVRSFAGNFDIGQNYISQETSPEFKKQYSQILFSLGKAYKIAKPKSEVEKEDFFKLAINKLKEALIQDSTNSDAEQLLKEIKQNKFQDLIDKGKENYNKGVTSGNVNFYFTAEYYLKQALEFESANKEILSYLKKVEAKTFSVLSYRDGLSLAVLKQEYQKNDLVIYIAVKNYLKKDVNINLANFKLVDKSGETYSIYPKGMKVQELFGGKVLSDTTLTPNQPEIDGILVFNLPQEKPDLFYLSYQFEKNKDSRKYFP